MSRDKRIDTIKGILIVLVILGHLIGECGTGICNVYVRTYIYTFHMPLFILLSGYLTTRNKDNKKFYKGIANIGMPLIIFQFINAVLLLCFQKHIGIGMLVIPYWTLWYLLSLISWRLILKFSPNCLLKKPSLYLAVAFILSIVCGVMPMGRLFSIQRTVSFFPFFLYGYYIKQGEMRPKLWRNEVSYCFICIALLLIVFRLYPENSELLLKGADHYGIHHIPSKIYLLICAFVTSLSFFNITTEGKVLSVIGKDSLLFYLYHGIIIRFAIQPLLFNFGLPKSLPFMLMYCVLIVLVIFAISRIKLFRFLCNPLAKKY